MGALAPLGEFLKEFFIIGWLVIIGSSVLLYVWYGVIGAFFRPARHPAAEALDAEPCPSCAGAGAVACAWCGGAQATPRPARGGPFAPASARSASCARCGGTGQQRCGECDGSGAT